ncbi:MAG: AAA family ATPase [Clostridia bacterium]|nr:AAA family ATPase [Clostridia bacterium]
MIENKKQVKCGLIGKTLRHSFSPQIHKRLADYSYTLFELSEDELGGFVKNKESFDVCNVTIPYKKAVMPYLDEISEEAKKIGSVNTLIRRADGTLRGENTDYFGFSYMLCAGNISVRGKKVAILGTGGASATAYAVCSDMGAEKITFVSRKGEINYENVYEKAADCEIIINCTPVGMYPNNEKSPIQLSRFTGVEAVADMIYNPAKTKLLLDAEALGINGVNGLSMLVAQAKRACELFLNVKIDDCEIGKITREIQAETKNIVLIGMPGCGKTTIAKILADRLGRKLIDTDQMIVDAAGTSIPEIFAAHGESYFRELEHRAAKEAGKMSGCVIATGGGIVTHPENYNSLCQNANVVFIRRDLSLLSREGRPLSIGADLEAMYKERLPMYRRFCDLEVSNDTAPGQCSDEIIKAIGGK